MGTWQQQYAIPNWKESLTKLNTLEESQFHQWVKQNNVPVGDDYDMRGYWKALQRGDKVAIQSINPNDHKMHFPDNWKTPLHESFSGESIYAKKDGPHWNPHDQLVSAAGKVLFDEPAVYAKRRASQPMAQKLQLSQSTQLPTIIPYDSAWSGSSDPTGKGMSYDQAAPPKSDSILPTGGILGGVLKALGVTHPDNQSAESEAADAKKRKAVGDSAKSFASDPEAAADSFMGPQSGGAGSFNLGHIISTIARIVK